MDLAASRLSFLPLPSSVAVRAPGLGSPLLARQGLDATFQGGRPLLASQTLADLFAFTRQRDDRIRALTPDNLKGAASPGAMAATIASAPYPSGQHSAYDNVNGAFSETLTMPPTRIGLATTSA
jgi:hypothetical protein